LIEVVCFERFEDAAHLVEEANALNQNSTRPDPFSTLAYARNHMRHDDCEEGGALWLLAAFRGNDLVGYVPMRLGRRRMLGLSYSTLSFLMTHDTDRPHLVARQDDLHEVAEAVYAYLISRGREWSLLEFYQQDAESPLLPPPRAADLKDYLVRDWPTLENGTIHMAWASLPEYVHALPRKFRCNVERQWRGLAGAGHLELLSSTEPAASRSLLDLYLSIESHSWKPAAQVDISRTPRRLAFLHSLLEDNQPMRISILLLMLDGVPVAGLINGRYLNGLYALHIVYDMRWARLSPGSAILLMGVGEAIDQGCAFFNLLSGFSYYKTSWLAEVTPTRIAQIYRRGSLPYWHRRAGDWWRRFASPAAPATPARFNPARRAVLVEPSSNEPGDESAERARAASLREEGLRQGGHLLAANELAAVTGIRPAR
jgi:hypothetical protein